MISSSLKTPNHAVYTASFFLLMGYTYLDISCLTPCDLAPGLSLPYPSRRLMPPQTQSAPPRATTRVCRVSIAELKNSIYISPFPTHFVPIFYLVSIDGKIYGIQVLHGWGESDVYAYGKCRSFTCLYIKISAVSYSGFGDFINIKSIVGFCLEFGREEFLYTERVLFVSVRQVFVIGMLRNVVLIRKKRTDTTEL